MMSRGEVALIVANKGEDIVLLGSNFLEPIGIMVIITTVITPIILKLILKKWPAISTISDGFSNNYEEIHNYRIGMDK